MNEEHPNLSILRQFDPANIAGTADILSEDVIFHYYNPKLPNIHGDYVGIEGVKGFFEKIGMLTNSTFKINLISAIPMGDELVVVHRKQILDFKDQHLEVDVVVVWRIVEDKITEVWDIPSVYAGKSINLNTQS